MDGERRTESGRNTSGEAVELDDALDSVAAKDGPTTVKKPRDDDEGQSQGMGVRSERDRADARLRNVL